MVIGENYGGIIVTIFVIYGICPISGFLNGSVLGFPTIPELDAFYKNISNVSGGTIFPFEKHVIGKSFKNMEINAYCIGQCSDENAPAAFYNAMHHSREPEGMMVILFFMKDLVDKVIKKDEKVLALLSSRALYFVPLVNPDGYVYNYEILFPQEASGGGFQRKNMRPGCKHINSFDHTGIGVDLNRNYDACWNIDTIGSHTGLCDEDYRGTAPFSEPETQNIRDFVAKHNFKIALNYHSFGRDLITIPSCRSVQVKPSEKVIIEDIATELTRENQYQWSPPWQLPGLYPVNGDAADWMFKEHGIIAMSPEVAPAYPASTDALGFWPEESSIEPFAKENLEMNYHTAWFAGTLYVLRPIHQQQQQHNNNDNNNNKEQIWYNSNQLHFEVFNRGLNGTSTSNNQQIGLEIGLLVMPDSRIEEPGSFLITTNTHKAAETPPIAVSPTVLRVGHLQSREFSEPLIMHLPSPWCSNNMNNNMSIYVSLMDSNLCQVWRVRDESFILIRTTPAPGPCSLIHNGAYPTNNNNNNNNLTVSDCNDGKKSIVIKSDTTSFGVFLAIIVGLTIGTAIVIGFKYSYNKLYLHRMFRFSIVTTEIDEGEIEMETV